VAGGFERTWPGTCTRLELQSARGAQAHVWGAKHADNWAWVHCNDLRDARGEPRPARRLAGVAYRDPDGDPAYCYNTRTASIRLHLYERAPRVGGWAHAAELRAHGRAHFEYAQRTPVPDQELHLT
jgi:hypothetical protein